MDKQIFEQILKGEINPDETTHRLTHLLYTLDKMIEDCQTAYDAYEKANSELVKKRSAVKKAQDEILELLDKYKSTRSNKWFYNWGECDNAKR